MDFPAFETHAGDLQSGWLVVCDHASNALPPHYGTLGLDTAELERHIAYDIGARGVSLSLAEALSCPAVLSTYSRLLIDPNRGEHDPTLIMRLSDGAIVPGNHPLSEEERQHRITTYHQPYHQAIREHIDAAIAAGVPPKIISIHSFTPVWKGVPRPWHFGVLYDEDRRLVAPLLKVLEARSSAPVGDNEPYTGRLVGDCMNVHGTRRGLMHALIEVRNDLIAKEKEAERVGRFLGETLKSLSF